MTVKTKNFPWMSNPRTPAPPRKRGLEEAGELTEGGKVTEST